MQMARDQDGSYWIGSQRGLWRQRGDNPPAPQRLGGGEIPHGINALLSQADGALWVNITGFGLGYLRSDWQQTAQYSGVVDGLQGTMYRALAPSPAGGFWLGGYNGMVERLAPDGSITKLDAASQDRLRDSKLSAIAEDQSGRLWFASRLALMRVGNDGAIDEI